MTSFAKMHNDWLDPDRHLWNLEEGGEGDGCPNCEDEWDGVYCEACGWSADRDDDILCVARVLWSMIPDRRKRIELSECYASPEDMLGDSMPEGDFCWDDLGADDWMVYHCGEKDCPVGWHQYATSMEIKRTDGVWEIAALQVDEDGNWDTDGFWVSNEEGYGTFAEFYRDYLWRDIDDHFRGWAEYYLDVAETGNDVLSELTGEGSIREQALVAARDMIKYLLMESGR